MRRWRIVPFGEQFIVQSKDPRLDPMGIFKEDGWVTMQDQGWFNKGFAHKFNTREAARVAIDFEIAKEALPQDSGEVEYYPPEAQ